MDTVRLGLSIRALRRRRGWTQTELGRRTGASAAQISRTERGAGASLTVHRLERLLAALGARLSLRVLWMGEELDRILDRDHAAIVERMLKRLVDASWAAFPEVTFQIDGERGSIDILAWHATTATLLVIEVKSVVPDIQAMLAGLDRKARLAPTLARERGWRPASIARLLVLPDDRTARRRVDGFRATFVNALPARTTEVRRWLAAPAGTVAGVLFLSDLPPTQPRHRVSRTRLAATHRAHPRS